MQDLQPIMVLNSAWDRQLIVLYKNDVEFRPVDDLMEWCSDFLNEHPHGLTIAISEKTPFLYPTYHPLLNIQEAQVIQTNDIYHRFLKQATDAHKINVIHPCTMTHIQKYAESVSLFFTETYQDYLNITKILDGNAEANDVIHSNADFMLVPDSKWDRTTLANMYLLVLVRPTIKCLRDLDGSHLSLLSSIKNVTERVLAEKYNIPPKSLFMFVHYQPSYYHFHVHVASNKLAAHGGMIAGKAHLLQDIIENIQMDPSYYQKRNLTFQLAQNHPLFAGFSKK